MTRRLRSYFRLAEHRTTARREAVAGVTTFLTMAYIVLVNPTILGDAGIPRDALVTVTVLSAIAGTFLVGVWANVPFAMAPGMGLNAFFTYGLVHGRGLDWQTALGVVFLSGLFFLVLTLVGFRKRIVRAIPESLRWAVPVGIGLFLCLLGLQNIGLVTRSEATMVQLGELTLPVLLGLGGLLLTAVLAAWKVRGAVLFGILATLFAGMALGEIQTPSRWIAAPPSPLPTLFQFDLVAALQWSLAGAIFSFLFVDLFDSVGTVVACAYEAEMVAPDGSIDRLDPILKADAISTVVGAALGTSTTTTYIESAAGISAGGRTGLTSMVTCLCFVGVLFFAPIIQVVPKFATGPALVFVGLAMFRHVQKIEFARLDLALPALLTIVLMPLTYSIATGLSFGFLSYIVLATATGRIRTIDPLLWTIGAMAFLNLAVGSS